MNRVMESQDQEYIIGKPETEKKRDLEKKKTWKRKGPGKEICADAKSRQQK